MKVDFEKFKASLPYASELYGIYQPLLGWKSARAEQRVARHLVAQVSQFLAHAVRHYEPTGLATDISGSGVHYEGLGIASKRTRDVNLAAAIGSSIVAQKVSTAIMIGGETDPETWKKYCGRGALAEILADLNAEIDSEFNATIRRTGASDPRQLAQTLINRESVAAGFLADLGENLTGSQLMDILASPHTTRSYVNTLDLFQSLDPRKAAMENGVLSPIGVVHLFRQYFFEFDSFLGPSVQHIWLSPGASLELVEVSTRKVTTERFVEQFSERVSKSELSLTEQDELSDAVKSENASSTKFGVGLNTSHNFKVGQVYNGQVNTTTNYNIEKSEKLARETTHKNLRQSTSKLSEELRQSIKSSFRTVTETTDVSSRRYVLQNTTKELINYEMRRKMRQVGVQVQDYGTQLCWQTYVDRTDLGDRLGLGHLVHVAAPSDIEGWKDPESIPPPEAIIKGDEILVVWTLGVVEVGKTQFYPPDGFRDVTMNPPPGYIYHSHKIVGSDWGFVGKALDENGNEIGVDRTRTDRATIKRLRLGVSLINGRDGDDGVSSDDPIEFRLGLTILYEPSEKTLQDHVDANKAALAQSNEEKKNKFRENLFSLARERINLAGEVKPRPAHDLREEERIIVYRALIDQLLRDLNITAMKSETRHLLTELIQSMFDVDKMLYFVAPDWWQPRRFVGDSPQELGLSGLEAAAGGSIEPSQTFNWGGITAQRPSNYLLTEKSAPAPLGSSLGWIIQLDGDNLRNAFLNAPWAKAVVPIQSGHEWQALEWLSAAHVEGSEGLVGAKYEAEVEEKMMIVNELKAFDWTTTPLKQSEAQALTVRYATLTTADLELIDALRHLIMRINLKHEAARTPIDDPVEPGKRYLPTDIAFEKGFDPLKDGFNASPKKGEYFKIHDQWVEVVPTDQIVPVEVEYDPKTGMQK